MSEFINDPPQKKMLDAGCWMLDAWEEPLPSIQHPASSIYFHSFRASPSVMNDSSENQFSVFSPEN
jgi:hypothetical protein